MYRRLSPERSGSSTTLVAMLGTAVGVAVLFFATRSPVPQSLSLSPNMMSAMKPRALPGVMRQARMVDSPMTMCLKSTSPMAMTRSTKVHVTEAPPQEAATESAAGDVVSGEEADKEAYAVLRFVRGSPHKYRRVIDTIRGRSYEEALAILQFMPYRACENVLKVVRSAAANAAHNFDMKKSKLYISDIYVDEGPIMYRFKYRAQGRVNRLRKPTAHIFVRVKERVASDEGSQYFRRRRRRTKEVGPNWKGQYIEDPVEIVDSVEFEDEAVAEEVAAEVAPVEASAEGEASS